jgi:CheY-like chemotaxis protein
LFLPRSQGAVAAGPARAQANRITRGQHELVLVVEDDNSVRALTVELLHRLGYRTLAAGDAAGALRLLETAPQVSLLLADVVLPGGTNGAELAREITRIRSGLPVLFMSGYTEDALIHNGRLAAGVRLLEKPFSMNDLGSAVRKALDEV